MQICVQTHVQVVLGITYVMMFPLVSPCVLPKQCRCSFMEGFERSIKERDNCNLGVSSRSQLKGGPLHFVSEVVAFC